MSDGLPVCTNRLDLGGVDVLCCCLCQQPLHHLRRYRSQRVGCQCSAVQFVVRGRVKRQQLSPEASLEDWQREAGMGWNVTMRPVLFEPGTNTI